MDATALQGAFTGEHLSLKVPMTILELLLKIGFRLIAGGQRHRHGADDELGKAFDRAASVIRADGRIEAEELGAIINILITPRRDQEKIEAAAANEADPNHVQARRKLRRRRNGQAVLLSIVTLIGGGMDALDDALNAIADQDGDGQIEDDEIEDLERLRTEIGKLRLRGRD